jgi:hypothetical protein
MNVRVGDTDIDVAPDQLPAFTYQWTDLENIDKASGSRSTSMSIPATAINRRTLGGSSMAEDSDSRRLPFAVTAGGTTLLFEGTALVSERNDGGMTLVAYGDNATWMPALKDARLRQYPFGQEITVAVNEIRDTWDNLDSWLYFPLVDYGAIGQIAALGNVPNELLRPGIRVHKVLTKVFADAGYAVEAKGSFADLWKRLVTCNTFERIPVGPSTEAQNYAKFTSTNPNNGGLANPIESVPDVDEGGRYVSPGRYSALVNATFNVRAKFTGLPSGNTAVIATLRNYTDAVNMASVQRIVNVNQPDFDVDFGDVALIQGKQYGIALSVLPGTYTIATFQVEFTPLDIPYQDNITVTVEGCCTNITAAELLKRVMVSQCLAIYTRGKAVELWYYDEFFKEPDATCLDLTGRLTGSPVKMTEEQPSAYVFEHERDTDDRTLNGYGQDFADARYTVEGGALDEKSIDVGYTVSAMGGVLGGLSVPRLIDKDDPTIDVYDWEDRLLIDGGKQPGAWVQNGDTLEVYPYAFSAGLSPFSVAFGDVTRYNARGTVSTRWGLKMRHVTGPQLEADIYWHDHEIAAFDPRKPVRLNDGQMARWYYVSEITQHRYGMGRPTRTKLIPR